MPDQPYCEFTLPAPSESSTIYRVRVENGGGAVGDRQAAHVFADTAKSLTGFHEATRPSFSIG